MDQSKKVKAVFAFVVLACLVALGWYWYAQQGTNDDYQNVTQDNTIQSPSAQKTLTERMTICESILNGTTQEVAETSRVFVNLPEDVYPFQNRQVISHGATMGIVSNGEGLMPNSDFAANKCATHSYEFSGNGTVDMVVKSVDPSAPDYAIHFKVTKL